MIFIEFFFRLLWVTEMTKIFKIVTHMTFFGSKSSLLWKRMRKKSWWQKWQKKGVFIKCFRNKNFIRNMRIFGKFFMCTFWSEFLSFCHQPFFFIFFFYFMERKRRKKRKVRNGPQMTKIDQFCHPFCHQQNLSPKNRFFSEIFCHQHKFRVDP